MPRHKSRAFVLSAADYRETSKLLQLFCENEGRISLIARGLRSPKGRKAQLADTFNLLQVNYTLKDGATMGMLTGLEPEQLFSGLRTSLQSYALASYWFEILKFAGQERLAAHDVFELTRRFLDEQQSSENGFGGTAHLLLALAQELGFAMQLDSCSICGATDNLRRFSIGSGVAVCDKCHPPPGRTIPLPKNDNPAAFLNLYNEFITTHLEHRFSTFEFVQQVLRPPAPRR